MKIVFILPFLFRLQRGIERSGINLANALVNLGHDVSVLVWADELGTTEFKISPSIYVYKVPKSKYYQAIVASLYYLYFLFKYKFDVVNIYFADHGESWPVRVYLKLHPEKKINFIVGYPYSLVPGRFEALKIGELHQKLNKVIVKNISMVDELKGYFKRDIDLLPNGIDTEYFSPWVFDKNSEREKIGLLESDLVLLTVAHLEERKGIQYIIKAIAGLPESIKSRIVYLVVGEGSYLSSLVKLVRELGLTRKVKFVGKQTEVRNYYSMADLFCLLSTGEGMPNVILEAWSMGLPVITSDQTPFDTLITEPFLGMKTSLASREVISQKLIVMLEKQIVDPGSGSQNQIREYTVNNYNISKIASRLINISVDQC